MNATTDLQPELVEMFLATVKGSTADQRATVAERMRSMVTNKQTTTVKGQKVSVATFSEIVKRLEEY